MWLRSVAAVVAAGLAWGLATDAVADVFCKSKKGAIKVRAACKAKETQLDLSTFGAVGPQGEPGAPGADGQLRIYGDGSAGARTVAADENWTDPMVAPTNFQFTDVVVNAGVTLTVPSGTVIRCTGAFRNEGNIVVGTGAAGGFFSSTGFLGPSFGLTHVAGEAGIALRSAQNGELGDASEDRRAGVGGTGVPEPIARTILRPGFKAGGGGGAGGTDTFLGSTNAGSAGGGSLVVLCQGGVTNNGTVTADGDDSVFDLGGGTVISGGGGGGGGVVVLASPTQVTNAGTIQARGGAGQDSDGNEGPSGGGGGGIIHLLAPAVDDAGTEDVSGGAAGAQGAPGSVTADPRSGGGGGGGSGGNGGAGGGVNTAGNPAEASAGGAGFAFVTHVDPTALF